MNDVMTIEKIKFELIKSCINYDAISFIPFLMSKKVLTDMPNKTRFYIFFKQMIKFSQENSKGKMIFKIENINITNNSVEYYLNFYDDFHKYSRLTIQIKETKNTLKIDTLPF